MSRYNYIPNYLPLRRGKNSGDVLLSFVQQKVTDVEKNELEGDLTIEEIKKTVRSMKSFKSPDWWR